MAVPDWGPNRGFAERSDIAAEVAAQLPAAIAAALIPYSTTAQMNAAIAAALAPYYTSAQVDALLAGYYTSAQVDALLAAYNTAAVQAAELGGIGRSNAAFSCPNNAATILDLTTAGWDIGGVATFNAGTDLFTIAATFAGRFQITASGMWAASGAGQRDLFIEVNGAAVGGNYYALTPAGTCAQSGSVEASLAVGDTVGVKLFQNSGAPLNFNNARVSVQRLGDV